ncbi:MAG: hypothetical protein CL917_12205 [Deltaproteobacteria bacterium]|nr:hypothetical protein [Deltaproteobacteria bacterium]
MGLFERAAESEGRILQVEQLIESGVEPMPDRGIGYLLTFDIGRILVLPDRARESLKFRQISNLEEVAEIQMVSLGEEDPWWKVMGQLLTRAWPGGQGEGAVSSDGEPEEIRLQFRSDTENPKMIFLRYVSNRVHVGEAVGS